MIIAIVGSPGSGKDTQSALLQNKFGLSIIATGKLMRDEIAKGTKFGEEIMSYIGKGQWLPDDMTVKLLKDRLNEIPSGEGFILNGFPRTFEQIAILDKILADRGEILDRVIHLVLPEKVALQRMQMQVPGGQARPDSSEEAQKSRLKFHNSTVQPILEAYRSRGLISDIDSTPSIEKVYEEILKVLAQNP